jgi:RimJ/RimL family protein N-acetyltransferase
VRLICAWGFDSLGLERVALHAATANLASQHVAERAGFTLEATLRSWYRGKNGFEDMVAYGLLASDRGDRVEGATSPGS